jgi:hypothetical protein
VSAKLSRPVWRYRIQGIVFCIPTFGSTDTTYEDFCAAFEQGGSRGHHRTPRNDQRRRASRHRAKVRFLVAGEASAVLDGRIGKRWMGASPASFDEVTAMQTTLLLLHRDFAAVSPSLYDNEPRKLPPHDTDI